MVLLADTVIVLVSTVLAYWIVNRTQSTYEHRTVLFYTAVSYALLSWIGARIFRTYSGVLRFSSFVDLMKVTYANVLTMGIAMAVALAAKWWEIEELSLLTPKIVLVTFLIATLMMWSMRILVKLMYDISNSDSEAIPVLIYGALTGGIGLAKNIRSQSPLRYDLKGFITHENRIKDMRLMGLKVYTVDDDLEEVVRKKNIQGVLVSPLRIDDFRNNQKIQDLLINAGVKIFMAQEAKEAGIKNGELSPDAFEQIQLKEVSVEDLLPRSEIRVDMKSVGDQLRGKRVLITGSAGSIGMEIVRQVAQFGPEKMMLIDQAETPQHDVRLMMAKDFPNVACEAVVTSISRRTRMEYIFKECQGTGRWHLLKLTR